MNAVEISEVMRRVQAWEPEMRIILAHRILGTLALPQISEPPKKMSLDQIVGIMRTDAPPPDDEECARIVEEERWRKYG